MFDGKFVVNVEVWVIDSCIGKLFVCGVIDCSGGLFVLVGLFEFEIYGVCENEGSLYLLMVLVWCGDDFSFILSVWGEGIRLYDFDLFYGYFVCGEMVYIVFDCVLVC